MAKALLSLALALIYAAGAFAQGPWIDGVATFTQGPDQATGRFPTELPTGACGYGAMKEADYPGFALMGVSRSSIFQNRPMGGCGACVEVKCTNKEHCASTQPIQVQVYDACDRDCGVNQLNLNARAFQQIAPLELGRTAIMYREVPCSFKGGIVVSIDSHRPNDGGWIRLSLRNVAGKGDITSVQLAQAGTNAWKPMKNSYGAQWEASVLPNPPLSLKITTAGGQSVVLDSVISRVGVTGLIPTNVQFTRSGGGQQSAPAPASKPASGVNNNPAAPTAVGQQGMQAAVPVMVVVPAGTPIPQGGSVLMAAQMVPMQQGGMMPMQMQPFATPRP